MCPRTIVRRFAMPTVVTWDSCDGRVGHDSDMRIAALYRHVSARGILVLAPGDASRQAIIVYLRGRVL